MRARWGLVAAVASLLAAGAAFAQSPPDTTGIPAPAAADTSFGDYLNKLRDSTDVYFGQTVAPVDTAGLDSALAAGLARPYSARSLSQTWKFAFAPWLTFNRVDGPFYGGGVTTGRRRALGEIGGRAGYAVGSDTWLGAGKYIKWKRTGAFDWHFEAEAGRLSASVDRERSDLRLAALRAFLTGNDTRRYLRHDGLETSLEIEHAVWRGVVSYRDMLESPLGVTARWNLMKSDLAVSDNLAAAKGHVHEMGYLLGARTPFLPLTIEAEHFTSGDAIGSDFDYRRTRLALGGDVPMGRTFLVIPQLTYGRLSGQAIPQSSFYLGGSKTLRSLQGSEIGGTGMALARLDVMELPDILEVLRIPHPDMLPIQLGAFVASGAVWGIDPYGGPTRPGVDWPNAQEFRHEAGVSILYRPGIPDPSTYMQIGWAWPIGPKAPGPRFSVSYSRGVDLVRLFGRDEGP